ncbi:MAG: hypothetical protein V1694_12665 [Candidatus Eisenbacteria bacterium]
MKTICRDGLGLATGILCVGLGAVAALSGPAPPEPDSVGRAFDVGGRPVYGIAPYDQDSPAIAFDGLNYLVVWNDCRTGSCTNPSGPSSQADAPTHEYASGPDIFATRVSPAGAVLDRAGIALCVAPGTQTGAAVASGADGCLVVWCDCRNDPSGDIYGARISLDGVVVDPAGIPLQAEPGSGGDPAVAFDGTNYLVVWSSYVPDTSCSIRAVRVAQDGTVLDRTAIDIATKPWGLTSPAVAFDGTNYLVVWEDYRDDSAWHISGTRIGRDGTVLDPRPFLISQGRYGQLEPAVAFDGTNYLVVWRGVWGGASWDICGARVDVDGHVLDPSGFPVTSTAADERFPAVAFDGTNYLVAWRGPLTKSGYSLVAARVAPDGALLDPLGIPVSSTSTYERLSVVASSGGNHLVVWSDGRNYHSDVYGVRIDGSGQLLDDENLAISTAASLQTDPAVAFGGDYFVVWADLREGTDWDIYGTHLDARGKALERSGIAISTAATAQQCPAVAFDGVNYLVVWQDGDGRGDFCRVHGVRVNAEGEVLDPSDIVMPGLNFTQVHPAVAFDGVNYLVVWQDYRDCHDAHWESGIYGARIAPDGRLIDASAIPICTEPSSQRYPSVAFDGTNYLVVWEDGRKSYLGHIYGARVTVDGTVLDQGGVPISGAGYDQKQPSVAFDGTNCLVVWQDFRASWHGDIYGVRVDAAGQVLDPTGIAISVSPRDQQCPVVAFDGSNYVVAWSESLGVSQWDVRGTRVRNDGSVVDASGFSISAAGLNQRAPVAGAGPCGQTLVAYSSFTLPPRYGSDRIRGNLLGGCGGKPGKAMDLDEPRLYQNHPDPFVGPTSIRYYLPRRDVVSLMVYDVQGHLVESLLNQTVEPGMHEVVWDGRSHSGPATQGVYFYRLESGVFSATRKMVLLK